MGNRTTGREGMGMEMGMGWDRHREGRVSMHESGKELFGVLGGTRVRKADERAIDGAPGGPFDLHTSRHPDHTEIEHLPVVHE